ncbi:SsgA family sporulation/cell division regulator [Actinacidiphila glaucinigra]|uniref:SsgA family sporulation/cell division regulator n=1 Tax=Actinacidiphila glaucinigra TaxID=235986 RepID=UPI0035E18040
MKDTVVERELMMHLVLSPQDRFPVMARLIYRVASPCIVHIAFHIDSEEPVYWFFARELLMDGVFRPSGSGDVRVWPARRAGLGVVMIWLSAPDGSVLLEAPAAAVAAWLGLTVELVPPDTESTYLRQTMNQVLDSLLKSIDSHDQDPQDGTPENQT